MASSLHETPSRAATFTLTALTMLAFAGNSLLTRPALRDFGMSAAAFMLLRLGSGALMLGLLQLLRRQRLGGDWVMALGLFGYAVCFTFAYLSLSVATGALLVFGAVQAGLIAWGVLRGERLRGLRLLGSLLAFGGLVALLLPGLSRPPLHGALLMLLAGLSWCVYTVRGKGQPDPLAATAGNFARAALLALPFALLLSHQPLPDSRGVVLAICSGVITSALGYALWYAALRGLSTTEAATVQLSAPVIAAAGGALLLGETLSLRLGLCALAILGGIALAVGGQRPGSAGQAA